MKQVSNRCDECTEKANLLVVLGDEYSVNRVTICLDCLHKAVALLEESRDR